MKLSSIKINGAAIENGDWVGDIPGLEGVRLKVRGLNNRDYRRMEAKLTRAIPRERRALGIDPQDEDDIQGECLKKTVLMGWEGIENDHGEPMPYSEASAAGLIDDPDYLVFRNAVLYASTMVAQRKADDQRADAGN